MEKVIEKMKTTTHLSPVELMESVYSCIWLLSVGAVRKSLRRICELSPKYQPSSHHSKCRGAKLTRTPAPRAKGCFFSPLFSSIFPPSSN